MNEWLTSLFASLFIKENASDKVYVKKAFF